MFSRKGWSRLMKFISVFILEIIEARSKDCFGQIDVTPDSCYIQGGWL